MSEVPRGEAFRDELAKELKREKRPDARRERLEQSKDTDEYWQARRDRAGAVERDIKRIKAAKEEIEKRARVDEKHQREALLGLSAEGGQTIYHLHLHLLGGHKLGAEG